ncbi:MAG: porin family protein [Bacteroidota bacterium]
MKKILTATLVVLCLGTAAFSQSKGTTDFGVTVGYNAATVTSGNLTNSDYRSGFNAGVSVEHYFSDSWSFKGRLIYDQKGWNSGYIATGTSTTTTNYQLDYLTVPLFANWHFGRTKNWYLNFGPYVGFLLSASETAGGRDVKSFFNSTDGGLGLGIGVKFPVSDKSKFFIEANGQGGVTDLGNGNSGSTVKSSVSAINIGFTF